MTFWKAPREERELYADNTSQSEIVSVPTADEIVLMVGFGVLTTIWGASRSRGLLAEVLTRGKDVDTVKWVQGEQVEVASTVVLLAGLKTYPRGWWPA